MKKVVFICHILLTSVLYISCVYRKIEKPLPEKEICFGTSTDSAMFKKHIVPIILSNCANPGCHSGPNPEGNINLEAGNAYKNLTNKSRGYLDTLNPEYSLLYNSLTSPANIMPPTGKMDDCKIETITKWMRQKAKNN